MSNSPSKQYLINYKKWEQHDILIKFQYVFK